MNKNYFLFVLAFMVQSSLISQNCSVNANIDLDVCQNETLTLNGTVSGIPQLPSDLEWTQVAGPSVAIVSPNTLTSAVIGYVPNQSYTFRLSRTCDDGVKVFDDVTYTTLPITSSLAGPDQTACPGFGTLAANTPGLNEAGAWSIVGMNGAGVTGLTTTNPSSGFTTPASSAGQTTLRWTITNSNGCTSSDDVVVTNYGGVSPVSVSPNTFTLSNCFSTTQCYTLNGTFGGNGFGGQQGTWSQVSGPTNVSFTDVNARNSQVCGLAEGCYVFRWTVAGPCSNGSDTVRVCVPKPTQSVTNADFPNQTFCDGRAIAVLVGTVPVYSGERVIWEQTGGPAGATIIDSTSSTTAITGLNGSSTYTIRYTIINDTTGCSRTRTRTIRYRGSPFISPIRDTVLPCDVSAFNLPISVSGGNRTRYRIMSAPDAWSSSAPTAEQTVSGGVLSVSGLDAPGDYIIRVRRTTNNGVGCSDYSLDFKVTVSIRPLGASAGTDQVLACNITSTQLAGNEPVTGYGNWTQVSGPSSATIVDSSVFDSDLNDLIAGVYEFKWVITGGAACPKVEDNVIVVHSTAVPVAVNAGPARTVCFGAPIKLDANIPLLGEVGVWTVTPSAGITITSVNNPKATVTGLVASTAYTFQWKVTNLCGSDSSSVVITTNSTQGPPQAMAGSDRCLGSGTTSITLAGNDPSPATGLWTLLSGPTATITNNTLFNTTVTGMTDGIYLFEWRNLNGICDPTLDTVEITISAPAAPANAGNDIDSCSNSVTMAATTPITGMGTWSQFSGPAGWMVDDINSPTARFTNLVSGEYQFIWTVSNGSCSGSTDTVILNIDNVPTIPTAGMGQKNCGGSSLTLSGNTITFGSASWSVLGSAPNTPVFADVTAATTNVSGLVTGIYQFLRTNYSSGGICPSFRDTVSDTIVINASAGADQSFCGNESVIVLTGPENSIGTWTRVTGGTATITPTSSNSAIATMTSPTGSPYDFEFLVPTRWGCPATRDTTRIIIDDTTNIPSAGTDKLLCTGTTVTMDANDVSPDVGLWTQTFGPSSTITNNNLFNTTVTNINTAGIYLYRWRASNGVCRRSDEVRIEKFDPPTTAAAGPDVTICPDTFTMSGNAATTGVGKWTQLSGPSAAVISEQVNPATSISGLNAVGTYIFEWAISNGAACSVSRDTIEISVPFLKPTTPNAGIDSTICNRNNSALTGNIISLGSGIWSQYTASPTAVITTATSPTSALTLPSAGTYGFVWTATNGGCVIMDTVIYAMSDLPTLSNAGMDINSCIGEPIVLSGNNPSPNTGTWRQLSGPNSAIFSDSNSQTSNIFGIGVGTFDFRWQVTSGSCPPSNDTVQVNIVARPADAIAGVDQIICSGITVLNGSQDSVGTGTWSLVGGPNVPTITTPANEMTTVTGMTNGTYRFRWAIVSGGCTEEDTLSVTYGDPEVNNSCANADSLSTTTPSSSLDSLCSATAEVGEPSTCGRPACNSLMYKFRTNPSPYFQDLDINFTSLSTCSNGLRVSLFEDGPCPTLGSQFGTCRTISTVGTLTFSSLSPNTVYYLIVDDNSPTCGASTCQFEFTLGNYALPVELINLEAELLRETETKLKWKTASEINTDKFEVYRKTERDVEFVKVGEVKAAGNSSQLNTYTFLNPVGHLLDGNIIYKIKTIDLDGTYSFSNAVKVNLIRTNFSKVNIYPNPNLDGIINVSVSLINQGDIKIEIYDQSGKKIKSTIKSLTSKVSTSQFDLSKFAAGVYTVKMSSNGTIISEKLVLLK